MDASFMASGPLDVGGTLERYRAWGEDPATRVAAGSLRRAVRVDGGEPRGYVLTWSGPREAVRLTVSVASCRDHRVLDAAVDEARRLCGLPFDLGRFYHAVRDDRVLGGLTTGFCGLRPTLTPLPLEMLVGAICAQQVNLAWAFTVRSRLVRRYGEAVAAGEETVYAFPRPETLARASVHDLRALQFTTKKAEYIVELGRLVASGALDLDGLAKRENDEVITTLTAVRGLGRWTAEWFLARGLGRLDVCPAGDLGVRKAVAHFYARGRELAEDAVRRRAARWGEHGNLATHYLLAGHRAASRRASDAT
jgi:DNA-3-methyladenine glycosylase II